MNKVSFILLILVLVLSFGCGEKTGNTEELKPFIPPADGKIAEKQKDSYIKASIALKGAMDSYSLKIKEFVNEYKVQEDLTQMSDTIFLKEHPEIKKAWDGLSKEWIEMQNEAYKIAGIIEDEFNWIGGALTDTINAAVQKKVEKALTTPKPETETKTDKESSEEKGK